jgi:spermidine synthase
MVSQATSPLYARAAFWCINDSMAEGSGVNVQPYHAYIPSFGEWGFVLATPMRIDWGRVSAPAGSRFLTREVAATMTDFPPDMAPMDVSLNRIGDHAVLRYYEEGWGRWFE